MPQQGPSLGTVAASVGGGTAWNNVNNILTSGSNAWVSLSASGATTQAKSTGFNFSIPSGATIDNIEVTFHRELLAYNEGFYPTVNLVKLVKADVVVGNNLAASNPVVTFLSDGTVTYSGTPSDWGVALAVPDVNGATFGFVVSAAETLGAAGGTIGLNNMRIKVTYTELPSTFIDVTSFISIAELSTVEVEAAISLLKYTELDIKAFISLGFGVSVTSPAAGCPTFTNANINITWDISQGIQASFRVQVYRDNLGSQLVYDSGVQTGSVGSWFIPPGALPAPETLYVRVSVTNTDGGSGSSSFVCFNTSFPTSVNVSGVTVRSVGGCDNPEVLPGIKVSYSQVAPGGGETFSRYGIRRRMAGETNFILIAEVDSITSLSYIDYNVMPRQRYEYAVIWIAKSGTASFLISANQANNPGSQVDFEFNFLHTANINSADPDFRWLRVDSWEASVQVSQDIKLVQPWGRDLPTVHVGQALGTKVNIPLHDRLLTDTVFWKKITEMILAQRDSAAVLCLRFGRGRQIYFGIISNSTRSSTQKMYSTQLELSESFYDQDLTPGQHSGVGSGGLSNNNG